MMHRRAQFSPKENLNGGNVNYSRWWSFWKRKSFGRQNMNSSDSCQFLFNFHVAFVTLCLWGSPWVAWRLPTVKVALDKKRVKITFIHFWWRSKWPANFSTNSGGTVFGWGGQWALSLVGVTHKKRVRITFLHFRCTVTTTEVGLHYLLHHLPMTWCHPRATLPSSQVASSLPSLRCIIPLAWMGTRWPVWTPATNHEAIKNLSHYCDISTFSFLFLRITMFESCSKRSLLFS